MSQGRKEAEEITDATIERGITPETDETTEREITLGTAATTIGFAINATTLILALEQNVIAVAIKKIQPVIPEKAEMIQGVGILIGAISLEIIARETVAQETTKRSMIMIGIVQNATIQTSHLERNVIVVVSQGRIILGRGAILETGTEREIMGTNLEKLGNLGSREAKAPGMLTIEGQSRWTVAQVEEIEMIK